MTITLNSNTSLMNTTCSLITDNFDTEALGLHNTVLTASLNKNAVLITKSKVLQIE
jgi:hypothetical protein